MTIPFGWAHLLLSFAPFARATEPCLDLGYSLDDVPALSFRVTDFLGNTNINAKVEYSYEGGEWALAECARQSTPSNCVSWQAARDVTGHFDIRVSASGFVSQVLTADVVLSPFGSPETVAFPIVMQPAI